MRNRPIMQRYLSLPTALVNGVVVIDQQPVVNIMICTIPIVNDKAQLIRNCKAITELVGPAGAVLQLL